MDSNRSGSCTGTKSPIGWATTSVALVIYTLLGGLGFVTSYYFSHTVNKRLTEFGEFEVSRFKAIMYTTPPVIIPVIITGLIVAFLIHAVSLLPTVLLFSGFGFGFLIARIFLSYTGQRAWKIVPIWNKAIYSHK